MNTMRGSIVSNLVIAVLLVALIAALLLLFVRSIGCDEPYENDATIGGYWIHFQVGNDRPECVQPDMYELSDE